MAESGFVQELEEIWNGLPTALILFALGAGACLWAIHTTPLPGVSVAILGAAAAVMCLRPKMTIGEKAAWMVLISALLFAEIRSIRADRTANDVAQAAVREDERQSFEDIAKGLSTSISLAEGQYESTIHHVDTVSKTTQQVAASAQKNLNIISGAGSYPCVIPDVLAISGDYVPFSLRNMGDNPLFGVSVSIANHKKYEEERLSGKFDYTEVGIITQEWPKSLPAIIPEVGEDGIGHYTADMWTQNGYYIETMIFRPSRVRGIKWAYQYWLTKARIIKGDLLRHYPKSAKGGMASMMMPGCSQSKWSDGSED